MILAVPSLVITLMYFMFSGAVHPPGTPSPFNNACLILLGLFPWFLMFVITSITMQRERSSGTLERILTTRWAAVNCSPPTGWRSRSPRPPRPPWPV